GAVLIDVSAYAARGGHNSGGVMNPADGKVKIIEEDGGNAVYSRTGHLLFARGDAILAAPFDPGRAQVRGAPVAVWGGLGTAYAFEPAAFTLTDQGALFYRPGQLGGDRSLAFVGTGGSVVPSS